MHAIHASFPLVVLGKQRQQPGQAAAQSGRVFYDQVEAGEAYS